jgi:hypothetical protein
MACFRAWEDWAIYASEYLINLQNVFLGLVPMKGLGGFSESVCISVCSIQYAVANRFSILITPAGS